MIIDKLNFDVKQIALYELLIKAHRTQINQKENEISRVKIKLYNILNTNESIQKDRLIQNLGHLQSQIKHYIINILKILRNCVILIKYQNSMI